MSWILVKEVAGREIRTRSRTKAFRIITGILVAASIIGPIVAAVWPEGSDDLREVTVGLVDVDEATQQQILAFSEDSLDVTFQDLSDLSANQVDQALTDGDINVRWSLAPRWSGTVKPTSKSPVSSTPCFSSKRFSSRVGIWG